MNTREPSRGQSNKLGIDFAGDRFKETGEVN